MLSTDVRAGAALKAKSLVVGATGTLGRPLVRALVKWANAIAAFT
jgi:uncharacterized protein YbjT (DUF2867 family)